MIKARNATVYGNSDSDSDNDQEWKKRSQEELQSLVNETRKKGMCSSIQYQPHLHTNTHRQMM